MWSRHAFTEYLLDPNKVEKVDAFIELDILCDQRLGFNVHIDIAINNNGYIGSGVH